MRKKFLYIILLSLSLLLNCVLIMESPAEAVTDRTETAAVSEEQDWNTFIEALAWVESRWDDNAVSNREAVGYLQITPILVKDANRIEGEDIFTLEGRTNREENIRLFHTIMQEYNPDRDKHLALKIWNPYAKVSYHRAVLKKYHELKSGKDNDQHS